MKLLSNRIQAAIFSLLSKLIHKQVPIVGEAGERMVQELLEAGMMFGAADAYYFEGLLPQEPKSPIVENLKKILFGDKE